MGKIRRIVGSLFRRPIDFSDQLRTEPISRKFGFDRGCPIDRYYEEFYKLKYCSTVVYMVPRA